MDHQFSAESIAQFCCDFYSKLPKTGKPKTNEWTVMSCIVKSSNDSGLEVVSLGTGSKCIGKSKMTPNGHILNDCHAEVMARRGFLRYLYEQIHFAFKSKACIFDIGENSKLKLKNGIFFHLFTSQSPCGDGSIVEGSEDLECSGDILLGDSSERKSTKHSNINPWKVVKKAKISKMEGQNFAVTYCEGNTQHPIENVEVLGKVRTKPGKGDPTESLSCSDKIARWLRVGIQGALLDLLLEFPIQLQSIIVGGNSPFSKDALYRALADRNFEGQYQNEWLNLLKEEKCSDNSIVTKSNTDLNSNFLKVPVVEQSKTNFQFTKKSDRQPCDASVVWCQVSKMPLEIAVAGYKQGTTKKSINNAKSSLQISKMNLFKQFMAIISLEEFPKEIIDLPKDPTYKNVKAISRRYYQKWNFVKNNFFNTWSNKPDILNFSASD